VSAIVADFAQKEIELSKWIRVCREVACGSVGMGGSIADPISFDAAELRR
jgi:hypothetical protein